MVKPNVTLKFVSLKKWQSFHVQAKISNTKNSAVRRHMLVCDKIASFEDFSALANGNDKFRIKLQESLLKHCDGLLLNKTCESAPLMLFS